MDGPCKDALAKRPYPRDVWVEPNETPFGQIHFLRFFEKGREKPLKTQNRNSANIELKKVKLMMFRPYMS